jgi:hypothetical protein
MVPDPAHIGFAVATTTGTSGGDETQPEQKLSLLPQKQLN